MTKPDNRYRVTEVSSSPDLASLEVAWFENTFHRVVFGRRTGSLHSWLVRHFGNRGVSALSKNGSLRMAILRPPVAH